MGSRWLIRWRKTGRKVTVYDIGMRGESGDACKIRIAETFNGKSMIFFTGFHTFVHTA